MGQRASSASPGEAGVGGPPLGHLGLQLVPVSPGGQRHQPEVVPLPPEHVERAAADRAGGTEHGHSPLAPPDG